MATLEPLGASTLEQLGLDEMIDKSTSIVRARILDAHPAARGPLVFTMTRIAVLEQWKGSEASELEVAIPGGVYGSLRQTFSGTPELTAGKEYILFLWTGPSGITQVIGLSQGVFDVLTDADGNVIVERTAGDAVMLDDGVPVNDETVTMSIGEMRSRVTEEVEE